MGSEIIEIDDGDFEWDLEAEEQIRSIEQSYYSSNSNSKDGSKGLDSQFSSSDHKSTISCGRSLPNWALSRSSCKINVKIKYPRMNFGGRIVYCRTANEVELAAQEILNKINARKNNEGVIALGFDIEWKPIYRQGEIPAKPALMQICMDNSHCYVLHIIYSGIPSTLKYLLEDESSIKVGVCILGDATKIWRHYDVTVQPLDDLSVCANAKLGGPRKQWSLSSLTETLTCKELAKPQNIRTGNWEASPLSKEQLQYAATDAFASWYIYEVLKTYSDLKPENKDVNKDDVHIDDRS